jgi:hypothetical protein
MNLTNDHKKALFVLGVGFALFWIFKPKMAKINATTKVNYTDSEADPKDRTPMKVPTMSQKSAQTNPMAKNGFAALRAYIDAYNNGEPQSVLDELNREFAKEFKVKVYRRKSDNKLVVCDLDGKEIMVNN